MISPARVKRMLLRIFPPPQFVRMQAVGVDVTDFSLKYLLLSDDRGKPRVAKWGIEELPAGAIEKGVIKEPRAVTEALRKVQRATGVPFVHLSLPEEHAYLFITDIPAVASIADTRSVIELKLKENVPLSPAETVFDYAPLCEVNQHGVAQAAVSVYPQDVVAEYVAVCTEAGLMPLSFEIEGAAASRATVSDATQETVMLVDLGKAGAGVSIMNGCSLAFTSTLEVTGDDLTRAISRTLNVSYAEAERLKKEKGFVKRPESEDVFAALLGTASALRDEIVKHFAYWQVHSAKEYAFAQPIKRVLLVGGNANLRGLREYLAAALDVPIERGNVWVNVASFEEYIPPIPREESYRFATAIGLALRGTIR
jgi:type IV pilus assembly protein PilM